MGQTMERVGGFVRVDWVFMLKGEYNSDMDGMSNKKSSRFKVQRWKLKAARNRERFISRPRAPIFLANSLTRFATSTPCPTKIGAGQAASLDPALTYLFWYYHFDIIF